MNVKTKVKQIINLPNETLAIAYKKLYPNSTEDNIEFMAGNIRGRYEDFLHDTDSDIWETFDLLESELYQQELDLEQIYNRHASDLYSLYSMKLEDFKEAVIELKESSK